MIETGRNGERIGGNLWVCRGESCKADEVDNAQREQLRCRGFHLCSHHSPSNTDAHTLFFLPEHQELLERNLSVLLTMTALK